MKPFALKICVFVVANVLFAVGLVLLEVPKPFDWVELVEHILGLAVIGIGGVLIWES